MECGIATTLALVVFMECRTATMLALNYYESYDM
jgi:hypothetical protein